MAERFTTWRDAGTGIAPFIPLPTNSHGNGWTGHLNLLLKYYTLGPCLALIKITLSLVVLLFVFLTTVLLEPLTLGVADLRRVLRLTLFKALRIPLFLAGFYSIPLIPCKSGGSVALPSSSAAFARGDVPDHGDILVANHSSYTDLLYFAFRYAPVFLEICPYSGEDGNRSGGGGSKSNPPRVREISLWRALLNIGTVSGHSHQSSPPLPLAQVAARARLNRQGPVLILPEGTTTNGRGLLTFPPLLFAVSNVRSGTVFYPNVFVFGLKYTYHSFSPAFPCGSLFAHVFTLHCQWVNSLKVYALPREMTAPGSPCEWSNTLSAELSGRLSRILLKRVTGLTLKDKEAFLKAYHASAGSRSYRK